MPAKSPSQSAVLNIYSICRSIFSSLYDILSYKTTSWSDLQQKSLWNFLTEEYKDS